MTTDNLLDPRPQADPLAIQQWEQFLSHYTAHDLTTMLTYLEHLDNGEGPFDLEDLKNLVNEAREYCTTM